MFKINPYCVGGCHYSGTVSIVSHATETGRKFLVHDCIKCKKFKSVAPGDDTTKVKGLGSLSEILMKASATADEKLSTSLGRNP